VEARALLLSGRGEVLGLEDGAELSFVVREAGAGSFFVVGTPAVATVRAAVRESSHDADVIAPMEGAPRVRDALPGWTCSRIIVHELPDLGRLPEASAGAVDFLDPAILRHLPIDSDLAGEIEDRDEHFPIAVSLVAGQPVAFSYAGAATESLWDISIDTLREHRRSGHAALCVAHLIRHMWARGKRPVWQAVEENPASWRLAQKLGFVPVDELALFARDDERPQRDER
jgi:GNAT superfamily N-acetyltransferase